MTSLLVRFASTADRAVRLTAYFCSMAIVSLYCDAIGRVWCNALAPEGSKARVRRANRLMRHWSTVLTRQTLAVLTARLDVHGDVPRGRFIVVANHQSIADIAIMSSVLQELNVKFVAKESLGRGIPAVSLALRSWGSALISRNGSRQDVARLRRMASQLDYWDGSVVIFPEGTRSLDGRLLPFKPAAIRIVAEATDLPILPVAIDGTHVISDLWGFARNMVGARGTLTIGTPVAPEVWHGRIDEVVQEVRDWVGETVKRGRESTKVPVHSDLPVDIRAKRPYQGRGFFPR